MKGKGQPLVIFYLLVTYIIIQFCWWAYHIYDLNKEIHDLQIQLQHVSEDASASSRLDAALDRRFWMILGEGAVFLTLLVLGVWKTSGAFRKEVALSTQQRNFLLSITHELKSPIAATRLSLETLLKHDVPKEKKEQLIEGAIHETDRLTSLVDNMLLAAKIDTDSYRFVKEPMNLSASIGDLVSETRNKKPKSRGVTLNIAEEAWIKGDSMALSLIISNLLDNAVKYSSEDSPVEVEVAREKGEVILRVKDKGEGISDKEKKNIFKKFYRIGKEETRQNKGTGLGLYIVNYLAARHDATLSVTNNSPKGTIFEIRFKETDKHG